MGNQIDEAMAGDDATAPGTIQPTCPHCGFVGHPVTQCPRVAAVEYNTDGTIRRVEYHKPEPIAAQGKPLVGFVEAAGWKPEGE